MKRLAFVLTAVLLLIALPRSADAQLSTGVGVGAKMLLPTGDLNDVVTTGWGLAATGELGILGFLAATGEIGYNKFPGESGEVEFDDLDVFGFTAGARLYLAMLFVGAEVGYYTDIDESGFIPNIGLRIALIEVAARYKANDSNWFEIRGTVNF